MKVLVVVPSTAGSGAERQAFLHMCVLQGRILALFAV